MYTKYIVTFCSIFHLLLCHNVSATPRHYKSFGREQSIEYNVDPAQLVRIWMFNVGQGDSILIQIPGELMGQQQNFDVLIDTGSYKSKNRPLAHQALRTLYPDGLVLENIILSHHDSEHVSGLAHILSDSKIGVENIWHNGLASYLPSKIDEVRSAETVSAVWDKRNGEVRRFMALYDKTNGLISEKYIVDDINELSSLFSNGYLHGIYQDLAKSTLLKTLPFPVTGFKRFNTESKFLNESRALAIQNSISFEPIWPLTSLKHFKTWSETINGNSITFKFTYGDFSILLTGDHNDKSEKALLSYYGEKSVAVLESDVLKVPYHGSKHNDKTFFDKVSPVLGIASMGKKGFETDWKHPSEEVINYLGGSHRLFSTYIQEKRFNYRSISSNYEKMVEKSHILIETDGSWFRVVELNRLSDIPSVSNVKIGNGTRWIKAK